ncbi:MAG: TonB-dependent receptor [Alphaproteobacteria bacterium]|nr:TonB-dependent receptor [Alphaproteobacteria bacterium]
MGNPKKIAAWAVLGLGALAAAGPAQAIDQIVVTAQKRAEALSEVPLAVTALSGEEADRLGLDSTLGLAGHVPGVAIGQNSGEGDFPFISIRGVTMRDFADTNESPSAVYLDEFYKANLMGLDSQIFDVERIEVLRGPQGTLYGRNATGGVVKYVTRKPGEAFEGHASASVGEYGRVKLEGAAGGPLAPGLAGRLSILHHRHDGYTRNIYPGADDGNALDVTAVRGQLAYRPSADLKVSLLVQNYLNDNDAGNMFSHRVVGVDPVTGLAVPAASALATDSFGYRDPTPGDARDTNSNRDIYLDVKQLTAVGTVEWTLGEIALTSVTGYEKTSKDALFDSDSSPNPRGTETHPDGVEFAEELRLAGRLGTVDWLAGIYYFNYDISGYQRRQTSAAGPRPPVFFGLQTESWAAFASLDVPITDRWSFSGGLRYTADDKDYALFNSDFGVVFNKSTAGEAATRSDDNLSFDARLAYRPAPGHLVYAGIARGFKGGTFNVGFTPISADAIPVEPERLTSYEVGLKSAFFDERLRLDLSGFRYDYADSQAFQFDGRTLSATTFNRDAEIWGAELEASAAPAEGLDLRLVGAWLDATLKDVELPGPSFLGGIVVDRRMPLAPRWSWTGLVRYAFPLSWGGSIALQGDVAYKSEQYFDAFNSPSHREDAYAVGNARVSWLSPDKKLELAVWAENIWDTEYRTYAFDLSFLGLATDVWGKPRWVGATATYRFGG